MNVDDIMNAIAETTTECLRNWDIQQTIEEIRNTPELIRLTEEIKNGKSALNYFERMGV